MVQNIGLPSVRFSSTNVAQQANQTNKSKIGSPLGYNHAASVFRGNIGCTAKSGAAREQAWMRNPPFCIYGVRRLSDFHDRAAGAAAISKNARIGAEENTEYAFTRVLGFDAAYLDSACIMHL
jgi:hypothetical protein